MVTFLLSSTVVLTSSASSEGLVLTAKSTILEYKYNQPPAISGIVTDLDGNPLSRVSVYASFPYINSEKISSDSDTPTYSSTIIGFTTFNDGKFLLNPTNPSPAGEHTIKVTAKTDQTEENIFVTFTVKEDGNIIRESIDDKAKASIEIAKLSYDVLEQKMESQKEQYSKIQNPINNLNVSPQVVSPQLVEPQVASSQVVSPQLVEPQVASNNLEDDLKEMEEKYARNSPRNAFAGFIETVDLTLRNLFWGQFEFTENKTNLAHQAKIEALEDGQTSHQAMKVFQKTAATPLSEIIEYNEMLNVKYGFANQTVQENFDKNGKLPRNGK